MGANIDQGRETKIEYGPYSRLGSIRGRHQSALKEAREKPCRVVGQM